MSQTGSKDEPQDEQIVVGKKTFTLRFSTQAWAALVKLWGLHSVQEAQARLTEIGDATDIEPIVDVLWAALQRHHKDVSREEADTIADDMGIKALADVLPKLLRAANPPAGASPDAKKKTGRTTRR